MSGTFKRFETLQNYQKDIGAVFSCHTDRLTAVKEIAADISEAVGKLDAFIGRHAGAVCPGCRSVCCINRHSYHALDDIVYLYARERKFPAHSADLDDSAPCQFLGKSGCRIPRDSRPYRCNWYFCSPLLEHIVEHNSCRNYRFFIGLLGQLTGKRQKMMEEYASLARSIALKKTGST
jgi:hypothetical protein